MNNCLLNPNKEPTTDQRILQKPNDKFYAVNNWSIVEGLFTELYSRNNSNFISKDHASIRDDTENKKSGEHCSTNRQFTGLESVFLR